MRLSQSYLLFTDGSGGADNQQMGAGAVLYGKPNTLGLRPIVWSTSVYEPEGTNNVAELKALLFGLEGYSAISSPQDNVVFFMDSELVYQAATHTGSRASHTQNTDRIAILRLQIDNALRRLPVVALAVLRIDRRYNAEADRLATVAVTTQETRHSISFFTQPTEAAYRLPADVLEQLRQIFSFQVNNVAVTDGEVETAKSTCPAPNCSHSNKSLPIASMAQHVAKHHLDDPHFLIATAFSTWLQQHHKWYCVLCHKLAATSRKCTSCYIVYNPEDSRTYQSVPNLHLQARAAVSPPPVTSSNLVAPPPPFVPGANTSFFSFWDSVALAFASIRDAGLPNTAAYIPEAIRTQYSLEMARLCRLVVEHADTPTSVPFLEALWSLQALPRLILTRLPKRVIGVRGRRPASSNTAIYKDRLRQWHDPSLRHTLIRDTFFPKTRRSPGGAQPLSLASANQTRAMQLATYGRYGHAMQALMSYGVKDCNSEAIYDELRPKFPSAPPATNQPPTTPSDTPKQYTITDLQDALRFPRGSSAGPDGFYPQYLRDLCRLNRLDVYQDWLEAYLAYLNLLARGTLPGWLGPYIASATLVPLTTKTDGTRPIGVGEVHRRLVSKMGMQSISKDRLREVFGTTQLAFERNGCETITHALRYLFKQDHSDGPLFTLGMDGANAFGNIDRAFMFQEIRHLFPELAAYIEFCYGKPPRMFLGVRHFLLHCGVQQGDPLSPLLFCLVLRLLTQDIDAGLPEGATLPLHTWYMDDMNISGQAQAVSSACQSALKHGPKYGIHFDTNPATAKSTLHVTYDPLASITDQFASPTEAGFPSFLQFSNGTEYVTLGTSIAAPGIPVSEAKKRVTRITMALTLVQMLPSLPIQFALLQHCVGMQRLTFSLRNNPTNVIEAEVSLFDQAMETALAVIIPNLTPHDIQRLSLAPSRSGFGIALARYHAHIAYAASLSHSLERQAQALRVPIADLYPDLVAALIPVLPLLPENSVSAQTLLASKRPQELLTQLSEQRRYERLLNDRQLHDPPQARIMHAAAVGGEWLQRPQDSVGFIPEMQNESFLLSTYRRLGKPIYTAPFQCPASRCTDQMDIHGHHAIKCAHGVDFHRRHTQVRNTGYKLFHSLGYVVGSEDSSVLAGYDPTHQGARPADISVASLYGSSTAAIDFSIAYNVGIATSGTYSPMHALEDRHAKKHRDYDQLCATHGVVFRSFVMGSHGGFDSDAEELLSRLALTWSVKHGIKRDDALHSLRMSFSVALETSQNQSLCDRGLSTQGLPIFRRRGPLLPHELFTAPPGEANVSDVA